MSKNRTTYIILFTLIAIESICGAMSFIPLAMYLSRAWSLVEGWGLMIIVSAAPGVIFAPKVGRLAYKRGLIEVTSSLLVFSMISALLLSTFIKNEKGGIVLLVFVTLFFLSRGLVKLMQDALIRQLDTDSSLEVLMARWFLLIQGCALLARLIGGILDTYYDKTSIWLSYLLIFQGCLLLVLAVFFLRMRGAVKVPRNNDTETDQSLNQSANKSAPVISPLHLIRNFAYGVANPALSIYAISVAGGKSASVATLYTILIGGSMIGSLIISTPKIQTTIKPISTFTFLILESIILFCGFSMCLLTKSFLILAGCLAFASLFQSVVEIRLKSSYVGSFSAKEAPKVAGVLAFKTGIAFLLGACVGSVLLNFYIGSTTIIFGCVVICTPFVLLWQRKNTLLYRFV